MVRRIALIGLIVAGGVLGEARAAALGDPYDLYLSNTGFSSGSGFPASVRQIDTTPPTAAMVGIFADFGPTNAYVPVFQLDILPSGQQIVAVSTAVSDKLQRVSPQGVRLGDFGPSIGPGAPYGVTVRHTDSRVFATERGGSGKIHEYDSAGNLLNSYAIGGFPQHITWDRHTDHLFVSYAQQQVIEYEISGGSANVVRTINLPLVHDFTYVGGTTFRDNGNLLIARYGTGNDRTPTDFGDIREYQLQGGIWTLIDTFDPISNPASNMHGLLDVAIGSDGRVYGIGLLSRTVARWDSDGSNPTLMFHMGHGVYDPYAIQYNIFPEPTGLALLLVGGVLLSRRRPLQRRC